MHILVLLKMAPDVEEELEIAPLSEPGEIVRERARGGLVASFFVRFKLEGFE